jgi:predicted transcriptional regulator
VHNDKNATSVKLNNAGAVARVAIDYYLDSARLIGDLIPGDALTALVFLTIVSRMLRSRQNAMNGGPEKRAAVTVYAVAKDLGLSYETVRRHVKRLLDAGLCEREVQGLVVPAAVFERSDFQRAMSRNQENVLGLLKRLDEAAGS